MEEPRSRPTRYGTLDFCMETNLDYGFYEIMYEFSMLGWLVACSQTWGFARVSS